MTGVQPVPTLDKWGYDSAICCRKIVYRGKEQSRGPDTFREMLPCVPLRVLRLQLKLPSCQAVVQEQHPPLTAPEKYPLAPYFYAMGFPPVSLSCDDISGGHVPNTLFSRLSNTYNTTKTQQAGLIFSVSGKHLLQFYVQFCF